MQCAHSWFTTASQNTPLSAAGRCAGAGLGILAGANFSDRLSSIVLYRKLCGATTV